MKSLTAVLSILAMIGVFLVFDLPTQADRLHLVREEVCVTEQQQGELVVQDCQQTRGQGQED